MSAKTKKESRARRTLEKALAELRQESSAIEIVGRALTPAEKARLKALKQAMDLVTRAVEALR
jgi:hypothetical protein